jgi:hypothetical protein
MVRSSCVSVFGVNNLVFLLLDRIDRIDGIFLVSQLPDEAEKTQSAPGGVILCSFATVPVDYNLGIYLPARTVPFKKHPDNAVNSLSNILIGSYAQLFMALCIYGARLD